MASGDPQRVWFPEMLEELSSAWSRSMPWEDLARLCDRLTERRRAIRMSRGILPPRTRCPNCGTVSRADITGITIRSAIFALKKIGAVDDEEFGELDRSWRRHRAKKRLDAFGRQKAASTAQSRECHG